MQSITARTIHASKIWSLALVWILLISQQPLTSSQAANFDPDPAQATTTWTVTKLADTNDGVCSSKDCSLREAIDNAASGDIVRFDSGLSGGTIALSSTLTIAKNLTIDGSDLRPHIQISGERAARVFMILSGVVKLNHLTIVNGYSGADDGGGIYNDTTLYLTNCTLTGNSTDGASENSGGGIYNDNTLIIENSTFTGHSAYSGGVIYNDTGWIDISDSTFRDNTAVYGAAIETTGFEHQLYIAGSTFDNNDVTGNGGAITAWDSGTVSIANTTFSDNDAFNRGGAIYNQDASITVTNSSFENNQTSSTVIETGGGGIYNGGSLSVSFSTFSGNIAGKLGGGIYNDSGTITIASSTFSENGAGFGGGIGTYNGTATVTNSTFSGNYTNAGGGGGIAFDGGTLTVTNSTLSGNRSITSKGGAIIVGGTLHLANSILANDPISGPDCYNFSGTFATNLNNLIETNATDTHACPTPALSTDPMLGPLADNGGTTQTMALLPGSPALDMGDDSVCAAAPVNNLDQRGSLRPRGAHCDMGAFEWETELIFLPSLQR
ncbi:MAG: CSLREA domain-containing protein [Anaerolineales bacterium]|nr:CSLREA domain-containing protein [Anaerolineales bacterium]